MQTFLIVLIVIACVLLALVVLIQNPKGGGLDSNFAAANQLGGVKRTADWLEKATWTLATAVMALCLLSAGFDLTNVQTNDVPFDDLENFQPQDLAPAGGEAGGGEAPPTELPAE